MYKIKLKDIKYKIDSRLEGDFLAITDYINKTKKDIIIPESFEIEGKAYILKCLDNGAFQNKELINVNIPKTVKEIGNICFWNNKINSITIPNSVEYIGEYAFGENLITSVTIPEDCWVSATAFDEFDVEINNEKNEKYWI